MEVQVTISLRLTLKERDCLSPHHIMMNFGDRKEGMARKEMIKKRSHRRRNFHSFSSLDLTHATLGLLKRITDLILSSKEIVLILRACS